MQAHASTWVDESDGRGQEIEGVREGKARLRGETIRKPYKLGMDLHRWTCDRTASIVHILPSHHTEE